MRSLGVLIALCAVLAGLALLPQGEVADAARQKAKRVKPCPPPKTRVLEGGAAGLAYVRRGANLGDGEFDPVFLCTHRPRRHHRIGTDGCFNAAAISLIRFAGRRLMATSTLSCGPGQVTSGVELRRLRDGRRARTLEAAPDAVPLFDQPTSTSITVQDLVLHPGGTVAWIVEIRNAQGNPGSVTYEVRASAAGTGSQLLAAGADIAPGSLARAGSTIYWTQGGAARSAGLP